MFRRKYVHLAKGLKPQLTKDAADLISEEYTKLRNQENLEGEHLARVILMKINHLIDFVFIILYFV